MVVLTVAGNGLNLIVPRVIAHTIDRYAEPGFVLRARSRRSF